MKRKTIERILTAKHRSWCNSITDEAVRKLAEQNTIITGGAIVSLLSGQEVNDYDVYLKTPEAAAAIANYYITQLKANPPKAFEQIVKEAGPNGIRVITEPAIPEGGESDRVSGRVKGPQPPRVRIVVGASGRGVRGEEMVAQEEDLQYAEGQVIDDTEPGATYEGNTEALDEISPEHIETKEEKEDAKKRGKYRVLFVTANAITLSDRIQIVLRFNGDVDEIHTNYDFVHCLNAFCSWLPEGERLILRVDALTAIMAKELQYQGSKYPIASVIRTRKFLTRGWTINAGQYVKMAYQIAQLNLNDPMVLEDQLVGVDSAYFSMLISKLKEQMEKDGSKEVDGAYVMTLIDKIF